MFCFIFDFFNLLQIQFQKNDTGGSAASGATKTKSSGFADAVRKSLVFLEFGRQGSAPTSAPPPAPPAHLKTQAPIPPQPVSASGQSASSSSFDVEEVIGLKKDDQNGSNTSLGAGTLRKRRSILSVLVPKEEGINGTELVDGVNNYYQAELAKLKADRDVPDEEDRLFAESAAAAANSAPSHSSPAVPPVPAAKPKRASKAGVAAPEAAPKPKPAPTPMSKADKRKSALLLNVKDISKVQVLDPRRTTFQ